VAAGVVVAAAEVSELAADEVEDAAEVSVDDEHADSVRAAIAATPTAVMVVR
jgi:hypothetical protein